MSVMAFVNKNGEKRFRLLMESYFFNENVEKVNDAIEEFSSPNGVLLF